MRARTLAAATPLEALLMEQARLVAQELERTAAAAPDGHVLARVEAAALPAGRAFTRLAVEAALQAQAEAAEKKGRPAGGAPPAAGAGGRRGMPSGPS